MKIGSLLKELRNKKKLNQSEIAIKLNVTPATYSRYESDQLEPNLDKLLEISIILDEDPSIFFRAEMIKRRLITKDVDTGYSFIFTYWHLEEIAKVLNSYRAELSLPMLNDYAKKLRVAFEQLALAQINIAKILKPESFEEFLIRNKLEWLIKTNEAHK
jgi:transcriptional regulator with XRE-family HTH domain